MLRKLAIVSVVALAFGIAGVGCSDESGLKVKSWSPKKGPTGGGEPVTFYGNGFGEGGARSVSVYFGGNKARVLSIEDGQELMVAPPPGKEGETVDVELVFGNSKRLKIPNAYKYYTTEALTVDSLPGAGNDVKKAPPKKKDDSKDDKKSP